MPGPSNRFSQGATVINNTVINEILNQEFLTENGYTSITEILNQINDNGGKTIDLGDIGNEDDTTIEGFINALPATSYDLKAATIYFFKAASGNFDQLYSYEGATPVKIGAGGINVTSDNFKLLAAVDRTDPVIPDYSLPAGSAGQVHYITSGKDVKPDYTLKRGIITETAEEFAQASANGLTLEEIFNRWDIFVHSGVSNINYASPPNFPGLGGGVTQEMIDQRKLWGFDSQNDRIFLTQNFGVFSGFISPKKYISYTLAASLSSTNGDDDWMGLILAFYKDPVTGFEYTISAHRLLNELSGQGDITYAIYYNFSQNGNSGFNAVTSPYHESRQILIANGTALAPIVEGQGNGWIGNNSKLQVERNGDNFTVKCSQFGSDVIDDATLLEFTLNDLPELAKFKEGGNVGFCAMSQANAFFSNLVFSGFTDYIIDLQQAAPRVFEFDLDAAQYAENVNLTYADIFGLNRFVNSYLFDKTFYLAPDTIIKISEPPAGAASKTLYARSTDDTLIGTRDGINTVFTLPGNIKDREITGSVGGMQIYIDVDFEITGLDEITLLVDPPANDEHIEFVFEAVI